MDDVLHCPICGNKMRNKYHDKKLLPPVGKTANYAERICSSGHNHVITIWTDKDTKQVDMIKLSLNPKYSRFLEIDFVNQKCRITCTKDGESEHINIPKMIFPDFPDLTKLKEKVNLYVVFS
jgi:hypothetical protein